MIFVVGAKLIHQVVDHNAGRFVGFGVKFVDYTINWFGNVGNEVEVALLPDTKEADACAPIGDNFEGALGLQSRSKRLSCCSSLLKSKFDLCARDSMAASLVAP